MNRQAQQAAAEAFARIMERRHGGSWLPVVRRERDHLPTGTGQLGLEPTPDEFVKNLVAVFGVENTVGGVA